MNNVPSPGRRNTYLLMPDPRSMFQLNQAEAEVLRSQIATSKTRGGGRRYLPFAFTEHGVAMLSGVLTSSRVINVKWK